MISDTSSNVVSTSTKQWMLADSYWYNIPIPQSRMANVTPMEIAKGWKQMLVEQHELEPDANLLVKLMPFADYCKAIELSGGFESDTAKQKALRHFYRCANVYRV